jgi:hypothetical protein
VFGIPTTATAKYWSTNFERRHAWHFITVRCACDCMENRHKNQNFSCVTLKPPRQVIKHAFAQLQFTADIFTNQCYMHFTKTCDNTQAAVNGFLTLIPFANRALPRIWIAILWMNKVVQCIGFLNFLYNTFYKQSTTPYIKCHFMDE